MSGSADEQPWREPWLRSILRCPVDHAELADTVLADSSPALACTAPGHAVAYPVVDGIPVLLATDALPHDAVPTAAPQVPA